MADWALEVPVVADTTVVTERSLGARLAVSSLPLAFIGVVGTLEAWCRLRGLLWAYVTLGTDAHDTVIRDTVVSSNARLTPGDIRSSLDSIVVSFRTSGGQSRSLDAVVAHWADLSGITSEFSSEIAEVASVTSSLYESTIAVLGVGAEEALFRGGHSLGFGVRVEASSALSRQTFSRFTETSHTFNGDGGSFCWAVVARRASLARSRARSRLEFSVSCSQVSYLVVVRYSSRVV